MQVFQDHNDWIEIGDQHLLRSSSRGRKCSSKQINFKTIHSSSNVLIEISLQFLETSIVYVSTRYIIGNSIGDYHALQLQCHVSRRKDRKDYLFSSYT